MSGFFVLGFVGVGVCRLLLGIVAGLVVAVRIKGFFRMVMSIVLNSNRFEAARRRHCQLPQVSETIDRTLWRVGTADGAPRRGSGLSRG